MRNFLACLFLLVGYVATSACQANDDPFWSSNEHDIEALVDEMKALMAQHRSEALEQLVPRALQLCQRQLPPNAKADSRIEGFWHESCLATFDVGYFNVGLIESALPFQERLFHFYEANPPPNRYFATDEIVKIHLRLAFTYMQLGRPRAALPPLKRAEQFTREARVASGDPFFRPIHFWLAFASHSIGDEQQAARYLQAVVDATEPSDERLPTILLLLGRIDDRSLGRHEDALYLYRRAASLIRPNDSASDRLTVISKNLLARQARQAGNYTLALGLLKEADSIAGTARDAPATDTRWFDPDLIVNEPWRLPMVQNHQPWVALRAELSTEFANLYSELGNSQEAVTRYARVYAVIKSTPGSFSADDVMTAEMNLAAMFDTNEIARYSDAITLYSRVLKNLAHDTLSRASEKAACLHGLAIAHHHLHNRASKTDSRHLELAFRYAERALTMREHSPDNRELHPLLVHLAALYRDAGQYAKALSTSERALLLASTKSAQDPSRYDTPADVVSAAKEVGYTLATWPSAARPFEAVFFYKLAVDASQQLRAGTAGLASPIRADFSQSLSDTYLGLARLLANLGRYSEAEAVILLLKEAELREFTRGDPAQAPGSVFWTKEEQSVATEATRLSAEASEATAIVTRYEQEILRKQRARDNSEYTSALDRQRTIARRGLMFLDQLGAKLTKSPNVGTLTNLSQDPSAFSGVLEELRADQTELNLCPSAVITWIPDERSLTTLVTTVHGLRFTISPIPQKSLDDAILGLRSSIERGADHLTSAADLYAWLIRPARELMRGEDASVCHVMLNAVGSLRSIPFAALNDSPDGGKTRGQYLIEQLSLSLITAQTLTQLPVAPKITWQIAALGSGAADPNFGNVRLVNVHKELCEIVRDDQCSGVAEGVRVEDEHFDLNALMRALGSGNAISSVTVLHLATHYSPTRSLLLLGKGGAVNINELLQTERDLRLAKYDLVTLSACSSAYADAGLESLAGLLQMRHAKAVLGTLWSVEDGGTADFMVQFYRTRGEKRQVNKAKALQQTQLSMLLGRVKSDDPRKDLTKPYYWAPFVLMGNWL